MPTLTPEAWAQIRHDYEHTKRRIEDICAEHGISTGTLRDRMRRWGWTRRRTPVPRVGPAAVAVAVDDEASAFPLPLAGEVAAEPSAQFLEERPVVEDTRPITERLNGAIARVMPALENTLASLAAGPMQPRQMEQAARALGSLTRTLRELNGILAQHGAHFGARGTQGGGAHEPPQDIEALRASVLDKLERMVKSGREAMPRRYLAAWQELEAEASAARD